MFQKHFFKALFAETPLTADFDSRYLPFTDKAIQGSLLDLKILRRAADVHYFIRHCHLSLACRIFRKDTKGIGKGKKDFTFFLLLFKYFNKFI